MELDHVDYFKDDEDYNDAFIEFANNSNAHIVIRDDNFYQKVKI